MAKARLALLREDRRRLRNDRHAVADMHQRPAATAVELHPHRGGIASNGVHHSGRFEAGRQRDLDPVSLAKRLPVVIRFDATHWRGIDVVDPALGHVSPCKSDL
ncbi:hypothetical protein AAur_0066 [Paenarthrobacter aurescens TC1]|uniref:Uncharacterized protein n=1 Tax=Paenarthrobacter aurescens (strain TC1) TaxID=290340 RepID=A1R0Y4_PAEAT|nr:hypothetical protein AAur_0066 [Paenarthrobacter aurescens TC1]